MFRRFLSIVFALVTCGSAIASDGIPLPKDVPPVVGTAVVTDAGRDERSSEWKIRLTAPKITCEPS